MFWNQELVWMVSLTVAGMAAGARPAEAAQLETVAVTMRDGTRLATDVWRPDLDPGPRPVLLRRTPYGRAFDSELVGWLLDLGYVLVSQDVRGRGASEGEFVPFLNDAHDGFDTIAWAASQPWSNGRVGTFGGSAEGIVQLMAAGEGPPALRCAHVGVATGDVHEGFLPGGAWRAELTTAWLQGLGEPAALRAYRAHESRDAWWDPARLDSAERARIDFPILMFGGFFDIFASGTPRTHRLLQEQAAPRGRAQQFLLLGPWTHSGVGESLQGEVQYPADSAYLGYGAEMVGFFDWCLRDGPRPSWAPVRYYLTRLGDTGTVATGEWRTADRWPPAAQDTALFLQPDGLLSDVPPAQAAPALLPVDPLNPVPSRGGGNLSTSAGPFDQSEIDTRADVLVAQTPVSQEPVTILGNVSARLWAASSTRDADVIVRLMQMTPSGRAMLMADGVRRGRFVRAFDAPSPLVPGEPVAFDVDLGPVALVLGPGHALRVAIAGTSAPRYEPNPGTDVPLAQDPVPSATTLTVYRDSEHPSAISLPVASGRLPGSGLAPDAGAGPGLPDSGLAQAPGSICAEPSGCSCGNPGQHTALTLGALALALVLKRRTRG